jgi:hydroxymethylbilane synthase
VNRNQKLRVGCRRTAFCRTQTERVLRILAEAQPEIQFDIIDIPETSRPGAIQNALVEGKIDLHVRGARELPIDPMEGVVLAACTKRRDPFDVLVSQDGNLLEDLAEGARVAVESARVSVQLGAFREDLDIAIMSGTVDRFLALLEKGQAAAFVVPAEDVETLGWENVVAEVFPPEIVLPTAGQGSFAAVTRADDEATIECVQTIDHALTRQIVLAERAFFRELNVGLEDPAAVYGQLEGEVVVLEGLLGDIVSGATLRDELDGEPAEGENLGVRLAKLFIADGARDYLAGYK